MKRIAQAVWRGSLKEGAGRSSRSGAIGLEVQPRPASRARRRKPGAHAAAHASCFSMALG
jgi:hypothetical protein